MNCIATIEKLGGLVIEVEFFEAGNMGDARTKALNIALAEGGRLLNVRRA